MKTMIRVEDANSREVEIQDPGMACGHVYPGDPATVRGRNLTQRGFWGQAPGPCGYYTAWWEVDGKIYFPVGDEHGHRQKGGQR